MRSSVLMMQRKQKRAQSVAAVARRLRAAHRAASPRFNARCGSVEEDH
jgi:hypothetical protein